MSNLEMLQKLSLGKEDIEEVTLELEDDTKAKFKIRPLTDGELSKLKALEKKSVIVKIGMENGKRTSTRVENTNNDINVNTGKFTEDQSEAMYKAIALSLSIDDEEIPVEDVKNMRTGLPELLFKEVIRISKLTEDDLSAIKSFQ